MGSDVSYSKLPSETGRAEVSVQKKGQRWCRRQASPSLPTFFYCRHDFTGRAPAHRFGARANLDRDDSGKQWTTWLAVFSLERVSSSSAAKSRGRSWRTQSKSMERITWSMSTV